jgi:hypothetical protein
MNMFLNKGIKWGLKISLLNMLLVGILLILQYPFPSVHLIKDLGFIFGAPYLILMVALCGSWNGGIFGRCGSIDLVVAGIALILLYCIIGSVAYLIIRKIKGPNLSQ